MAITVSYDRVPGYPQETLSRQEAGAVDQLQCAWADRITLAKELLGYSIGGVLYTPHEFDFGDDPIDNIFCKAVDIEPMGGGGRAVSLDGSGNPLKAILTATYGLLDYSHPDEGTVYVSESLEPAAEFLTLGEKDLWWDNTQTESVTTSEVPGMIIRMIDWVYTIHFSAGIPDWVWTHPGTINNANVYSRELDKTFAAETLLCGNPSLSREVTFNGATAWTITARFTYRPETWNKFPHTDTTGALAFDTIYDKTTPTGVAKEFYTPADFGSIVI